MKTEEKKGERRRERKGTFPPPQTTTQLVVKSVTKEASFLYLERRKSFLLNIYIYSLISFLKFEKWK
jgi:hypothetical protein